MPVNPPKNTRVTAVDMPSLQSLDFDDDETTDVNHRVRDSEISPPMEKNRRGVLVVLRGPEVGRMHGLGDAGTTIGRDKTADIRWDDKGLSRKHARIVCDGGAWVIEDLGSQNGTWVDGRRIDRSELRDGSRIALCAGVVVRFNLVDEIEERVARQLFEASTRDALMGIYNRRYFDERLAAEVSFAHRHKGWLGLLLFDVDHFKRVNDTHGHQAGDVLLAGIARKVITAIRAEDVLARYGGEELVIIVRGVPKPGLEVLGERIRRAVAEAQFEHEGTKVSATISIGIATLEECDAHATGDLLVALADERLYRAKQTGRNRVCTE